MRDDPHAAIGIAATADLDRLHEVASRLPPRTRAGLYALLARLPAADHADLLALVLLADEEGFSRGVRDVDAEWQRTTAHFPGLAAALWAVHTHCSTSEAPCQGRGGRCEQQPLDPTA